MKSFSHKSPEKRTVTNHFELEANRARQCCLAGIQAGFCCMRTQESQLSSSVTLGKFGCNRVSQLLGQFCCLYLFGLRCLISIQIFVWEEFGSSNLERVFRAVFIWSVCSAEFHGLSRFDFFPRVILFKLVSQQLHVCFCPLEGSFWILRTVDL